MGPLIIFVLGLVAGALCCRLFRRFWIALATASLLATATWLSGVYLLLAVAAPHELGRPLLIPALLTLATAMFGAAIGGGAVRAHWEREGGKTCLRFDAAGGHQNKEQ